MTLKTPQVLLFPLGPFDLNSKTAFGVAHTHAQAAQRPLPIFEIEGRTAIS